MADPNNDILARLSKGTATAREAYLTNPALHSGQKPKIAVVGCSDSRVPTDVLFDAKPGDIFTMRNIGNSLEDEKAPNELSDDAKKFITYAHHLGVETLVIIPHGKCGCIANACSCAHGHAHGHGLEGSILKDMGDKKRFAVDLVKEGQGNAYLAEHGLPQNKDADTAQIQAVEIAHGFYQAKLARDLLKKLDSKMNVVAMYFDIATCDTFVSLKGDEKFSKVECDSEGPCRCGCSAQNHPVPKH